MKDKMRQMKSLLSLLKRYYLIWTANRRVKRGDSMGPVYNERLYRYHESLVPDRYPEALKAWYKQVTGRTLDLDRPRTFNEKIQWLKLFDSTPLKTRLTDKYLVRDWVKEKIGSKYLTDLLGVWHRFDDIDFDRLPEKFVLKATHGCGWNMMVDKRTFDRAAAKRKFDRWLNTNYAFVFGLELQYKNLQPRIIAEAYLENSKGDLYDYKIWCFSGRAEYIMFLAERSLRLKMAFYDRQWNLLPVVYLPTRYDCSAAKPDNLEEMIDIAEILSKEFAHVRVDLFRLNDGTIKFGEMTFTSASGTCGWSPPEYDEILGRLIDIDRLKKGMSA
jgi:hypothetical protein